MLKIVLLTCLVLYVQAQKDTNEKDEFKFIYDAQIKTMVLMTHTHCYILALSSDEQMNVHDPTKMEDIEVNMVALIKDTTKQTTVDPASVPHEITSHCKHQAIVKLTE